MIDPSYGRIRFQKFRASRDGKGGFINEIEEIESHQCSREELGVSGNDQKFWPINEGLTNEILKFIHLFACVDPDELEVSGGQGTGERIEV